MSAFTRLLHPPLASRRAYSSFFSSRSGGGGRYFNSTKPPKVIVSGSAAKNTGNKVDPSVDPAADAQKQGGGSNSSTSGSTNPNQIINANVDQAQSSTAASSSASSPSSSTINNTNGDISGANAPSRGSPSPQYHLHRQHPVINVKDFKLHQFFSLYRPLLLISHPSSILDSAPSTSIHQADLKTTNTSTNSPWLLDEFPEASVDADAAAARQLARALTIHHAGAAVAWEATLRQLGINVDMDVDRVNLQQQWDKEWQEVLMDSVKRKRRKKMKKHKLRKRRKATRASRLKIGR